MCLEGERPFLGVVLGSRVQGTWVLVLPVPHSPWMGAVASPP